MYTKVETKWDSDINTLGNVQIKKHSGVSAKKLVAEYKKRLQYEIGDCIKTYWAIPNWCFTIFSERGGYHIPLYIVYNKKDKVYSQKL